MRQFAHRHRSRRRRRADRTADRPRDPGRRGHPRRQPLRHEGRRQGRRLAGDGGRSGRRPHHRRGLARLVPGMPALSEERAHLARPPYRGSFFLIDPLDGTKEFVAGRNEFTVNLALVTDGTPLLGIIGAPALGIDLARHRRPRRRAADACAKRRRRGPSRSTPALPAAASPGPWRSAALHGDARTEAFIAATAGRGAHRARLGGQIRPGGGGRGRYLSPPRRRPANGTSRRATRSLPPPAARSRIQAAQTLQFWRRRERTLSCRNSSPGAIPAAGSAADSAQARLLTLAASVPQLRPALHWRPAQEALPGSAAKASRLSSRPNR